MNVGWQMIRSRRIQFAAILAIVAAWISFCVYATQGTKPTAITESDDGDASLEVQQEFDLPRQHHQATAEPLAETPSVDGSRATVSAGMGLAGSSGVSTEFANAAGAQQRAYRTCATIASTYQEHTEFVHTASSSRWGVNRGSSQPGTSLTFTKRGPSANPNLCATGCALLAFTIPPGEGWGDGAIVDEWFGATTNLYGAQVVAKVALELPRAHLPVNVRLYAQGDAASDYSWGTTASRPNAILSDISRFHEIVLRPSNRSGAKPFCAAATGAIGIQVQRSRSSSVEIPVKLYIKSVAVTSGTSAEASALLGPGGAGETDAGAHASGNSPRPALNGFEKDGYCQLASNGALSVASDDWVAAGTCQGYGFTVALGRHKDTKVVPRCDASRCTPSLSRISATGLCVNGTLAADPSWQSKVGVGFDFDPAKKSSSGLALGYRMSGTAILRFHLEDKNGNQFCVDLEETEDEGAMLHIPWSYFSTRCWDRWDPGTSFNPNGPLKGMQLVASCRAEKTSWFDMCVTSLATF